jgi:hypothetical protein
MFDYAKVTDNAVIELKETAAQIRGRTTRAVLDSGRDLNRIKALVDHGHFTEWVVEECGLSIRTAEAMMSAARWSEGKDATVASLPPGVIYLLAAPSVPAGIEERVMTTFAAGAPISTTAVRRWVATARRKLRPPPSRQESVESGLPLAVIVGAEHGDSEYGEPDLLVLRGEALASALRHYLSKAKTADWETIEPLARLNAIGTEIRSLTEVMLRGCEFHLREEFVRAIAAAAGITVAPGLWGAPTYTAH